jgi:hypothetical protein
MPRVVFLTQNSDAGRPTDGVAVGFHHIGYSYDPHTSDAPGYSLSRWEPSWSHRERGQSVSLGWPGDGWGRAGDGLGDLAAGAEDGWSSAGLGGSIDGGARLLLSYPNFVFAL